jgi:hypothetical protein
MVDKAAMATPAALVWTSLALELGAAIALVGVAAKLARAGIGRTVRARE